MGRRMPVSRLSSRVFDLFSTLLSEIPAAELGLPRLDLESSISSDWRCRQLFTMYRTYISVVDGISNGNLLPTALSTSLSTQILWKCLGCWREEANWKPHDPGIVALLVCSPTFLHFFLHSNRMFFHAPFQRLRRCMAYGTTHEQSMERQLLSSILQLWRMPLSNTRVSTSPPRALNNKSRLLRIPIDMRTLSLPLRSECAIWLE